MRCRTHIFLMMLFAVLAGISRAAEADELASQNAYFWQLQAQIEATERRATAQDIINIPAAYLVRGIQPDFDLTHFNADFEEFLLLPVQRVPDIAQSLAIQSNRSQLELAQELMRLDQMYRAILQNQVLPNLRAKSSRLLQRIAALTPVPAGRADANSRQTTRWSGYLDSTALAEAHAEFDRKSYTKLLEYTADAASLLIHADGRVELTGSPSCRIMTETHTTGGKDRISTTTTTTYQMDGPVSLKGDRFEIQATVIRQVRTRSGEISKDSRNTYSRKVKLAKAENGHERLLFLYNGQDAVPSVPWRLYAEIKK